MRKIMVLTDSNGNARSFPPSEVFEVEETWPYLLRKSFKDATFWQLSLGDMTTAVLVNQPMGYMIHWQPEVIIVHSGINDCEPDTFAPERFRTTVKKFKLVFASSRIFWLEIGVGDEYEKKHPGTGTKVAQCNAVLKEIYGKDFVPIREKLLEIGGFNAADHIHWNKKAHRAGADILTEKLNGV